MDGGKGVVEEEQKPAGDEVIVDCSDYLHQMFDEVPVPVRQCSFVKVLPLENPEVDAMIKKAEETIEKMNQDQVLLAQKIRKRVMDGDDVRAKLCMINYYDNCGTFLNWDRERLDILHLSLDKLTFANRAYKEKSINSCLSGGEVDKQKLSFSIVHGRKNMADERNLLKEIKASKGKDDGMTVEELYAPIQRLKEQWDREKAAKDADRSKTILKDIRQHKIAREQAIADAVVNGKLWNSLGSQEAIRAEFQRSRFKMKLAYPKVGGRNSATNQKRLKAINRKKGATYTIILKLKKQYEEERSVALIYSVVFYMLRTLVPLPKKVKVLAEKKALQHFKNYLKHRLKRLYNSGITAEISKAITNRVDVH
uniref:Proton pump-interactor 1-like n=1 Tax=Cucumis melo TaxID=3656 RepID=A0A9I9DQC5_CUCME